MQPLPDREENADQLALLGLIERITRSKPVTDSIKEYFIQEDIVSLQLAAIANDPNGDFLASLAVKPEFSNVKKSAVRKILAAAERQVERMEQQQQQRSKKARHEAARDLAAAAGGKTLTSSCDADRARICSGAARSLPRLNPQHPRFEHCRQHLQELASNLETRLVVQDGTAIKVKCFACDNHWISVGDNWSNYPQHLKKMHTHNGTPVLLPRMAVQQQLEGAGSSSSLSLSLSSSSSSMPAEFVGPSDVLSDFSSVIDSLSSSSSSSSSQESNTHGSHRLSPN